MRKIYLGLFVAFATLCTSCQFSESIYINEDGTGRVSFNMDGSELMDMMGDEIAKDDDKKDIDSIISFKELFAADRDSISKLSKAEQAKLKKLEAFKMHMVMNAADKKMNFDMFADFKNVNELQDMFSSMNTAGSIDRKNKPQSGTPNPLGSLGSDGVSKTNYTYKNNVFKRSVVILDKVKMDSLNENMGQAKMMFSASNYTLNYHFPRKIKSVSLENASISEDGKSVTAEISFMEYLKNPTILNMEVELEK